MKLVDILARELKPYQWPAIATHAYRTGKFARFYEASGDVRRVITLYVELSSEPEDSEKTFVTRAEWQAAVDALKAAENTVPEWNGEGLPPVGSLCEYQVGGGTWFECEIRYVTNPGPLETIEVVMYPPHLKGEQVGEFGNGHGQVRFRPIRTLEQIAREDRSKACDKMYGVFLDLPESSRGNASDLVEALYDAGCRFQVKP